MLTLAFTNTKDASAPFEMVPLILMYIDILNVYLPFSIQIMPNTTFFRLSISTFFVKIPYFRQKLWVTSISLPLKLLYNSYYLDCSYTFLAFFRNSQYGSVFRCRNKTASLYKTLMTVLRLVIIIFTTSNSFTQAF